MPVVAESPPLIFGGTPTPRPPVVTTPRPPVVTTPRPPKTPAPAPVFVSCADFVARHEQFINRVNGLGACFKRTELPDFTDPEFIDHFTVAMQDRYLTQEKDMYCSMQGISVLTKALKRLGED